MQLGHPEHPSSTLIEGPPPNPPGRLGYGLTAIHSRPAALSWLSQCHGTLLGSLTDLSAPDTGRRVAPVTCWSSARELGGLILEYARRTNDPERLDMAITLLQQACEDGPASGEARLINFCQLATALCTRFDACGRRADLDAAISVLERVRSPLAVLTGEESFHYPQRIHLLLARLLQRRFELTGLLCDLDAAAGITAITTQLSSPGGARSSLCSAGGRYRQPFTARLGVNSPAPGGKLSRDIDG
jgi:hypothetical protein